jgi:hypothetical protein
MLKHTAMDQEFRVGRDRRAHGRSLCVVSTLLVAVFVLGGGPGTTVTGGGPGVSVAGGGPGVSVLGGGPGVSLLGGGPGSL